MGRGRGWNEATTGEFPDWVQIDFNGAKTINEINVFTLQDNYRDSSEPTMLTTFSRWGITDFEIQYWDGSSWANIPGTAVIDNNKVWRRFVFDEITTTKIRVVVNNALEGYSRITEVEAWADN